MTSLKGEGVFVVSLSFFWNSVPRWHECRCIDHDQRPLLQILVAPFCHSEGLFVLFPGF